MLSTGSCSYADTCSEAQQTLTSKIGRDCPVSAPPATARAERGPHHTTTLFNIKQTCKKTGHL